MAVFRWFLIIAVIVVPLSYLIGSNEKSFVRYWVEETVRDVLRNSPIDDYDFWYFFDSGQEFTNLGYTPLIDFPETDPEAWQKQLYFQLFKKANAYSEQVTKWKNVKILELASGKGGGLKVISQHKKWSFTIDSATGVERSYQGWKRASEMANLPSNMKFINADSRDIPLENNTHEIVYSLEANGILNKKTFSEIHRILKPDGVFALSTIATPGTWERAIENLKSENFVFCDQNPFENITDRVRQARIEQDPIMQQFVDRLMRKYLYVVYPLAGFIDEGFRRPHTKYFQRAFVEGEEVYHIACFRKCQDRNSCNWSTPKPIYPPATV